MSAFKKFSKSDIFITPYYANKEYNNLLSSSLYFTLYQGQNITSSFNLNSSPTSSGEYKQLIYSSINHLFYQNYSSSLLNTHSLASSLFYESASSYRPTSSYFVYNENPGMIKNFPTGFNSTIKVISFKRDVVGTGIKEGSFYMNYNSTEYILTDDKKGNIINNGYIYVGNIFYSQGIIVLTEQHNDYQNFEIYDYTMSFQNIHPVYEQVIKCSVKEHEMNCSYNPSLKQYRTSESSSINDFATGSLFQPYFTTVGLYNDRHDLLAVAKVAKPILLSQQADTNVIIKLDV